MVEDRCDIFGFGNQLYRQSPGYWRENGANWKEQMASASYRVQARVKVRRLEEETLQGLG